MVKMGKVSSKRNPITSELSVTLLRKWDFFRDLSDKEISQISSFHLFYAKACGNCVGGPSTIFVTSDNQVYGFGHNCSNVNILGFGEGSPGHLLEEVAIPLAVDGLCGRTIRDLSVGGMIAAAVVDDGSLLWWGRCGRGGEIAVPHCPKTARRKRYLRVACGQRMMTALSQSKKVYVWGKILSNTRYLDGERLEVNTAIVDVSCGLHHCGLLGADGFVYGWGRGNEGQRGLPTYKPSDQLTATKMTLETCDSVVCGPYSTFVLTSQKEVQACGFNPEFHLGTDMGKRVRTLSRVPIKEAVREVVVLRGPDDISRMAAQTEDGVMYTWGCSAFPIASLAPSFFEIFSSWEVTPGLTSVCRPNPTNGWAAGLVTPRELRSARAADVLTCAYFRDRPRFAVASPPQHLAHVASPITNSACGKAFLLDKFFTDVYHKCQVVPEPFESHYRLL